MSGYQFINQAAISNAVSSGHNIDWAQLAQQWIQMRDSAKYEKDVNDEKGEADMDIEEQMEKDNSDKILQRGIHNLNNENNSHWDSRTETGTDSCFTPSRTNNQWCKWGNNNQTISKVSSDSNITKRQPNPTAHIPSLLKINVPHPNEIRALPDGPSELNNASNMIDASKRKVLPAWIREGLEKMEREKQKLQEKQGNINNFKLSDDECDDTSPSTVRQFNRSNQCSPEVLEAKECEKNEEDQIEEPYDKEETHIEKSGESYEQRLSNLMVVVRQTLTELLLEVTNEEIAKIANETVKNFKMKASSAQVIQQSALSTITGKLGLAVYGDSSSSDDDESDNQSKDKTFLSESDSEEDIKAALRLKKRSFIKIANEIEDRVAAAAVREVEKLKSISRKNESEVTTNKCKSLDNPDGLETSNMVTIESVSAHTSTGYREKIVGKINERDSGETTETKLQILNGKRQRDRGAPKERTTRFSDNKDNRYLAIAATATCIADQAKGSIYKGVIPQPVTSTNQTLNNTNNVLPAYNFVATATSSKASDSDTRAYLKSKNQDQEKQSSHEKHENTKRKRRRDSSSSSSFSSSSSSSSETSTTASSSTGSSNNSKYSRRRHDKRHTSHSRRNHRDKYEKSSHRRYRSRHHSESDDSSNGRRKESSRYSSHSRSRSRSHRDKSRSHSRSSYSYSGKRRH
ncbi:uncharacterized protein LOC142219912 isoform X2 [Haematobia irritans]|uniref:uncharacterized protein LOC142219912 isoform X2 n=1 Tax=Haematobia irritans TaxID=7368 RepID=UPI003F50236D